jgi:hypothetical protein
MLCHEFVLCVVFQREGIAYLESVKDITKILLNSHMIEVEKLKIE